MRLLKKTGSDGFTISFLDYFLWGDKECAFGSSFCFVLFAQRKEFFQQGFRSLGGEALEVFRLLESCSGISSVTHGRSRASTPSPIECRSLARSTSCGGGVGALPGQRANCGRSRFAPGCVFRVSQVGLGKKRTPGGAVRTQTSGAHDFPPSPHRSHFLSQGHGSFISSSNTTASSDRTTIANR
jgi:hypothetical protein